MNRANIVSIINAKGINATEADVNKNGVCMQGITMGDDTVRPTLYLNGLEGTDEEIADALIKQFKDITIPAINANVADKDFILSHAILCTAKSVAENAVSKKWLDIRQYVRVCIDNEMSYIVTKDMLSRLDLDDKKLFKKAKENLLSDVKIKSLGEVISSMMGITDDDEIAEMVASNPMSIVARSHNMHSSGVIACKSLFDDFCDSKGIDKLIIIPSSIHEILLVDATRLDKASADAMVSDVNATQVAEVDQLANHAYLYDRAERKMTV